MVAEGNTERKSAAPLVSIVTVVYNGEAHLQEAIDSVAQQTYPHIEYILIDGGSSDGTVDLIKSNNALISDWVSEPDNGIYDAMNKGIRRANGIYVGLVNADDALLPKGVERAVESLQMLSNPGYTCGTVELVDESGKPYGTSAPLPYEDMKKRRFLEIPCPHLGVFVHRGVYKQLGGFDTKFRLRADYDFLLRLINHDVPCVHLEQPIGRFRRGGASAGISTFLETFKVHRKHDCPFLYSVYVFCRSVCKSYAAKLVPIKIKKTARKLIKSKNTYY